MTSKGRPRSRDYDLRPNLNPTQFAQGTLFSGGPRTPQYHRGYTPERMAEVKKHLHIYGDEAFGKPGEPFMDGRRRTKAIVESAVARSTVPLTPALKRTQIHVVTPDDSVAPEEIRTGAALGTYESGGRGDSNKLSVRPEAVRKPTLIHELGHLASDEQGTEHSASYSYTNAHGGQEEAFADDFAAKHYRDRKGRPAPSGTYAGGHLEGRSMHFWAGYHANRTTGLDAERRRRAREPITESERAGETRGQIPLLDKSTTDSFDPTTAERRTEVNWRYR